ncbi:MAG: lipoprotein signal peptidase [Rikenellaceae bacterium]
MDIIAKYLENKAKGYRIRVVILVVLLLLLDQATKILVKTSMPLGESIHVFGDWFQIRFIENRGAAYGMELGGEYGKLALSLFRIVAVGWLFYYINSLIKKGAPWKVIFGFTLITVGAMGNIIDSLFYGLIFTESTPMAVAHFTAWGTGYDTFLHGSVVDMLYFPIINTTLPDWVPIWGGEPYIFFSPIFNVADSLISIGFIYMVLFCRKFFR